MRELRSMVELKLLMRDDETEEQAAERLYDLLYSELCQLADHHIEFWIESSEVEE